MVDFLYKVLTPQRPDHLVSRSRLNDLLSLITTRRLITLSAPAGYGKTSLLIDFASVASLPVCWYSLDSFDQDPWVFLDYLVAAITQCFPDGTKQTTEMLTSYGRTALQSVLVTLTRELYAMGRDFALVLDDWHLVDQETEISDMIAQLLLHCPHCHLILSSRTYPSLPNMMLLTARRQMSSLNEQQLRFNACEVAAVLDAEYKTPVLVEQVAALTEQANGWITGILLSLQALESSAAGLILPSTYAERQVYRYLAEQVFDHQPAEVRQFLLDAALLEDLTVQSCDAISRHSDSRRLLDMLLRRHLFVSEIRPGVLRFHSLFREFLQEHYATVDPARYRTMSLQVADAYAMQGHWLQAFERYMMANERAGAIRMIAAGGEQLYNAGRWETLEHWFSVVPLEDLDAQLLCLKGRVLLDRGNYNEARTLVQLAQTRLQLGDEPIVMLLQAQIERMTGHYEVAVTMAEHVLAITEDLAHRARAMRTIAICHHRLSQTQQAISELNTALAIEHERGDLPSIAQLHRDLGICHTDIGLLSVAQEYFTKAHGYWATIGNTGLQSLSLNSKGNVQRLAGHYLEAHATLLLARQYAYESALPHYQAAVLSSLGDLYRDLQLWERATAAYTDARKIGASAYILGGVDIAEVDLLVRRHHYDAAARSLRQLSEETRQRHAVSTLLLTSKIAYGLNQYDQAERDVQLAIGMLEQNGSRIDLASAYLLQGQIAAGKTPTDQAALIEPLERAVAIARQLGHDAFLIAETLPMRNMVRRAAASGWSRADDWLQRHQDMLLVAKVLEQDDQRAVLVVRTLGMDKISLNSQAVEVGWQKAREVLYYLLAHPDGAAIDVLREAIWPNLGVTRSRDALRSAIYQLRSVLPRDLIALHGRQVYQIDRDVVRIDYDVEQFLSILDESHEDDVDAICEAFDLYRGPYLSTTDNEWCSALRTHLERRYLQAHHNAAHKYVIDHRYGDALILYQQILAVDALDEAAHAGVMRCSLALGNRAAAISQYQMLRHLLDDELGLDPGSTSEVEQLYRQILAQT